VDRSALIAATVLAIVSVVAVTVDKPWRMELRRAVVVERDERPGATEDSRRTLARIQSNLERLGADAPLWPGAASEPLETVVDVVRAYRAHDWGGFDHLAATVEGAAAERLDGLGDNVVPANYLGRLRAVAAAETGNRARLARLVALLRSVDAVLVLEAAGTEALKSHPYDLVARAATAPLLADQRRLDGSRLRLPCRMIAGRRQDFEAIAARFGELAGPLLSCPVGVDKTADFGLMERVASSPKATAGEIVAPLNMSGGPARQPVGPPPKPWDRDAAIAFMAEDADAAEPALRQAATDGVGRLDLALFLHAFRPQSPQRDADVRRLLGEIDAEARAKAGADVLQAAGAPVPYDGTDDSLLPVLRLAAFTAIAEIKPEGYANGYPYAIPCAVWLRQSGIRKAADTQSLPGVETDFWLTHLAPISGCLAGRGSVPGFPEGSVAAFLNATADADGGAYTNHSKLPRYPLTYSDGERLGVPLLFEPRRLLALPEPVAATPYQHWSYLTLGNHAVWERLTPLFESARVDLALYFHAQGLVEAEAGTAATKALFALAYGANCGGEPLPSLRQMLIDGQEPEGILVVAKSREHAEGTLPPYNCAATSPPDPLSVVAVANPQALAALWPLPKLEMDANARNSFGKTPLMEAARIDAIDSAKFLLAKGARINADTWQNSGAPTLAHDGRTALMYAAASGSFAMIETLLKAGADTFQTDTKGRRAIDYLLGFGPLPANTRLAPSQRAEAARLLY